jgi:deferrochelatase/peroxidase EfeB
MTRFNVIVRRKIRMTLLRDKQGVIREHFGFVDGVSQPIPFGTGIISYGAGAKQKPDTLHAVAAGDILIGLQNADLEPAPGPFVSVSHSGAQDLPVGKAPYGYRDLGQDGSYLVIRELHQDFKGFWDSMKAEAEALGAPDHDDKWLAARVVGRTLDGDPLVPEGDPRFPGGIIAGDGDAPANDFRYFDDDHDGLGCPLGSHIRRANPRDGLAPVPEDKDVFLHVSNNHRILRRGRKFGPPYREDPSAKRGLLFMALNTDIARQFEFIQQNWMLNHDFAVLYDETDPLVGPASKFTVPMTPLRARVNVKTFVRLAGGDYFFLPSLAALDFLEKLP